jgi:hypothetical protein
MAQVIVVMNEPMVDWFKGWTGPVGRAVIRLANSTASYQRALAPRKTGALVASIRTGRRGRWAGGLEIRIGANPPAAGPGDRRGYSYFQNQGTMPHVIRARNAPALRFFWVKVGHWVTFKSVLHPGHRARHWADNGMVIALRNWG